MFTKLVAIIVLGMTLSLAGPNSSTINTSGTSVPEAMLSLCLGPMTIGFGAPQSALVNLSFDAFSHGDGHAGLIHTHISDALNPFRTHPSGGEHAQILPRRLNALP